VRFRETQDCLERSLARFCEAVPATSMDEAELVIRAALLERHGAPLRGARPARGEELLACDGRLPGGELRVLERLVMVVVCIDCSRFCHIATLMADTKDDLQQ
jgi:hypothetical protein